jgi:hypothetical protein
LITPHDPGRNHFLAALSKKLPKNSLRTLPPVSYAAASMKRLKMKLSKLSEDRRVAFNAFFRKHGVRPQLERRSIDQTYLFEGNAHKRFNDGSSAKR